MTTPEIQPLGGGRFELSGDLDFDTVTGLLPRGNAVFAAWPEAELNLARVGRANSAGLALLLEWLDHAQLGGRRITFLNLPDSLCAIARMSNLLDLLSGGADATSEAH